MVSGLFHIRLNDSEENKDFGFFTLMTSGASIVCLEDEEYIIDEVALKKLQEKNIKFESVEKQKVVKQNNNLEGNTKCHPN